MVGVNTNVLQNQSVKVTGLSKKGGAMIGVVMMPPK